jgi:excisionase family DNA binding protein
MDSRLTELEDGIARLERQIGQMPIDEERLYTMAEVAERLRCGRTNVYDLVDERALTVIRFGSGKGGLRVKGSLLEAFLDSRKDGGPSSMCRFNHLKGYLS